MTDDVSGEPLTQRSDDNETALRNRLKVFHANIDAVAEYYKKTGIYNRITADQKPDAVWASIRAILTKQKANKH